MQVHPFHGGGPPESSATTQRGFLRSISFELMGLLLFVAIFHLFSAIGPALDEAGLLLVSLVMAVVPALLWLAVFYRIDRAEPEPKRLVLGVYLMGLLLMAALYQPLFGVVFAVENWLRAYWWSHLVGSVLVTGMASMAIVYAAVRVAVFDNPEFDERLDGIIYAVAAGLGVATVHNFAYVFEHGGVDLDVGSIRIVVNALGYGGIAGVLGYFIGQARFEKTPLFYLPAGVVLSAALLGLYFFLVEQTSSTGLRAEFWRQLLLGLLLTLFVMGAVSWLVRRTNEETARVAQLAATGDHWEPKPVETASDRGE